MSYGSNNNTDDGQNIVIRPIVDLESQRFQQKSRFLNVLFLFCMIFHSCIYFTYFVFDLVTLFTTNSEPTSLPFNTAIIWTGCNYVNFFIVVMLARHAWTILRGTIPADGSNTLFQAVEDRHPRPSMMFELATLWRKSDPRCCTYCSSMPLALQ